MLMCACLSCQWSLLGLGPPRLVLGGDLPPADWVRLRNLSQSNTQCDLSPLPLPAFTYVINTRHCLNSSISGGEVTNESILMRFISTWPPTCKKSSSERRLMRTMCRRGHRARKRSANSLATVLLPAPEGPATNAQSLPAGSCVGSQGLMCAS